jgi:hypothetical protein
MLAPVSAPRPIPHPVRIVRSPNVGTGTSSGPGSTLMIATRRQFRHDMASKRTLQTRMLPNVIDSIR